MSDDIRWITNWQTCDIFTAPLPWHDRLLWWGVQAIPVLLPFEPVETRLHRWWAEYLVNSRPTCIIVDGKRWGLSSLRPADLDALPAYQRFTLDFTPKR